MASLEQAIKDVESELDCLRNLREALDRLLLYCDEHDYVGAQHVRLLLHLPGNWKGSSEQ